jgi:hypothetical protein
LRRCAVLAILMYFKYIPVSALRAPSTSSRKSEFLEVLMQKSPNQFG